LFCLWITILKKNKNISCNLFIFAYLINIGVDEKNNKGMVEVVEWEHEDGTWNTETITDIDNMTSNVVDEFLTEYQKTINKGKKTWD
jgi:hypothetical protein